MNVGGCDVFEIFFSILCDTLCVIDRDKKVEKKTRHQNKFVLLLLIYIFSIPNVPLDVFNNICM